MSLPAPKEKGTVSLGAHLNDANQIRQYARAIEVTMAELHKKYRTVRVLHVGCPFGGALVYHTLQCNPTQVDVVDARRQIASAVKLRFNADSRVNVFRQISTEYLMDGGEHDPYHLVVMPWAGDLKKAAHIYAYDLVSRGLSMGMFIPSEISYGIQIRCCPELAVESMGVYMPKDRYEYKDAFTYSDPGSTPIPSNKKRAVCLRPWARPGFSVGQSSSNIVEYAFVKLGVNSDANGEIPVVEFPININLRVVGRPQSKVAASNMFFTHYTMVLNPLIAEDNQDIVLSNDPDSNQGFDHINRLARSLTHPNNYCLVSGINSTLPDIVYLQIAPRPAGDLSISMLSASTDIVPVATPDYQLSIFPADKTIALLEKAANRKIIEKSTARKKRKLEQDKEADEEESSGDDDNNINNI